jgi:hypothetical protein
MARVKLYPDALGFSLFLVFGLGLAAWWWFALSPDWISWTGYQLCRVLGTGVFVWATSREGLAEVRP